MKTTKIPPELKYYMYQISLKIIVLNKRNETLLLHPSNTKAFKFDLPGGRIDSHESNLSLEKIIMREMIEELGKGAKLSLNLCPVAFGRKQWHNGEEKKFSAHYKQKNLGIMYIICTAKYNNGSIQISKEHTGYHWEKLSSAKVKKYFHPSLTEAMQNYFKYSR